VRYSPSLLIQTEPQQKHLQLINSDRDGDKDRLMEWAARKYVPRCTSCLPPQRTSHLVCRMHRVMFSTSLHSIDSVSDCHGSGSHTLTHTYSTNCDDVLYPVVYLINATSLAKNNAVEQLTVDVVHHKVHVVIVTESWLTEKHTDGCLSIPNYTLYRRDRHKRKGGGVCVFVRSDVDCEILPVCNDLNVEILWLRCTFHGYVYYVAGCYCPPKPKYDVGLFKCTLEDGIEMFSRDVGSEIIIIAGDYNSFKCEFLESQFGLEQIVRVPTHGPNILDKVFTNRSDIFSTCVFNSLIKTKHKAVLVSCAEQLPSVYSSDRLKITLFDLREHNLDYLRYMVATYDWHTCLASRDIQVVYDIFLQSVHELISHCVPSKTVTLSSRDPPFVTPLVKSLLKKRRLLRRRGRINEADAVATKINS